jgi:hypothetical protein
LTKVYKIHDAEGETWHVAADNYAGALELWSAYMAEGLGESAIDEPAVIELLGDVVLP